MKSKLMSLKSTFGKAYAVRRCFALMVLCLAVLSAYSDELSDAIQMAEDRINEKYTSKYAIQREQKALATIIVIGKPPALLGRL